MALNQFPRRAFSGAATLQTFTGNGSTTTFTLNDAQYQNECFVYVDDVAQVPVTDYGINSTTLTFTTAPANGSEIIVRGFGVSAPLNSVSDGSITSAKLATGAIEAKLGYTPISPTLLNTTVANLVNSAPSTLDTLNELATALGNDPNYATTITNALATKANKTGDSFSGHLLPATNNSYDIGSSTYQWRNIYTGDLHMSNESHEVGNSIDGTKGNWTIQEGDSELYIINNKNGKKYKFKLEEV